MNKTAAVSALFAVAALYDGLLGLAFLVAPAAIFERAGITPPGHMGYAQFPGALLVVFGLMFLSIALRPGEGRRLIPYGIGLKVSYVGIVGYYWFAVGIPMLWKPFAICDLVFIALFAWAYFRLARLSIA